MLVRGRYKNERRERRWTRHEVLTCMIREDLFFPRECVFDSAGFRGEKWLTDRQVPLPI
jgi:hypothetical protein